LPVIFTVGPFESVQHPDPSPTRRAPDSGVRNFRYLNIDFVKGCHGVDEFIITQHPMMNTITDFWQMIWNTNTSIIVSLYADEKSQVKIFLEERKTKSPEFIFSLMCLIFGHYQIKSWIVEILVYV
jgi:protein tyrosine phosphatase